MWWEKLEERRLMAATLLANGTLMVVGTPADDRIRVAKSVAAIDVSINGDTASFPPGNVTRIRVFGGSGNDALTLSAVLDVPSVPSEVDGDSGFDIATFEYADGNFPFGDHIQIGNGWLGSIRLTSVFSDVELARVDAGEGGNIFEIAETTLTPLDVVARRGNDTLWINAPLPSLPTFNLGDGYDTLKVDRGEYVVTSDLQGMTVWVSGGSVRFAANQHLTRLTVSGGGRAWVGADGARLLRVANLGIGDDSYLDLADAVLVFDTLPGQPVPILQEVERLLALGRNGTDVRWAGRGISSSTVSQHPLATLAAVVNRRGDGTPIFATFAGEILSPDAVIIVKTLDGDVNVDGRITADDYFHIDYAFLWQPRVPTFVQGDFNYDNRITADDYFLIDSAFLGQRASAQAARASAAAQERRERVTADPRAKRKRARPTRATEALLTPPAS